MIRGNCDTDRGVSSPAGYILNLGLAGVVLVSIGAVGLAFFAADDAAGIEDDLRVYGTELAGDIQEVDRLVGATDSSGAVSERSALGETARESPYVVEVVNATDAGTPTAGLEYAELCDRSCLVLATRDGDVRVTVNFVTQTPVETGRFDGGPVSVVRPAGAEAVTVVPLEA